MHCLTLDLSFPIARLLSKAPFPIVAVNFVENAQDSPRLRLVLMVHRPLRARGTESSLSATLGSLRG